MAVWRPSALAAAAALVLLSLVAAPADAETYRHRDKTHDVSDTGHLPCPTCVLTPAPTDRVDDLVAFGVDFRPSGLHLKVTTRSAPEGSPVPQVAWKVLTSSDMGLAVVVDVTKAGNPKVRVEGGGKKCDDTTARFDVQQRRWDVYVSLECLRDASWVQVGAISTGNHDGGIYHDDALVGGATCCAAPKLGPKVRRG